jgi:predicted oxidoreductase
MLKNHYNSLLVGKGFLSLLQAIKTTTQNKSVLLIDDVRFQTVGHQSDYISDL